MQLDRLAASLLDVGSLTKVLIASLLAGAGLVAIFALGIAGVSAFVGQPAGPPASSEPGPVAPRRLLGLILAIICFTAVLAGVVYGLYVMLNK